MKNILLFVSIFILSSCGSKKIVDSQKKFPTPTGYVNDFEKTLTKTQEKALSKTIVEFEKRTTNQIAIVTFDSMYSYTDIKDFGTDLGNEWGIGTEEMDNGLLILVSQKLKQARISTGLGTEKILTDSICSEVIKTYMLPRFKEDKMYEGIKAGMEALIKQWK